MKSFINLLLIVGLILSISCTPKTTENNAEPISETEASSPALPLFSVLSIADFKANLSKEGVKLIDVRRPEEFAAGHIENAVNINVLDDSFKTQVQEHCQTSDEIMLYCKSGSRSARATKILKEMGYQHILDLEGGFMAWEAAKE